VGQQPGTQPRSAANQVTLAEYRDRYALYKSDADLQAAHAAFPWLVTWDDHEVSNDYAKIGRNTSIRCRIFAAPRSSLSGLLRAHAVTVVGASARAACQNLHAGRLRATGDGCFVLDDRQYRSHQVCARPGRGGSTVVKGADCAERLSPALTLLGTEQEHWLSSALEKSTARWNIIAQQTLMANKPASPAANKATGPTAGTVTLRRANGCSSHIAGRKISNPIVLGGDVHNAIVADLKINFDDAKSPVVATEFVGTSITSQGPNQKITEAAMQNNPHSEILQRHAARLYRCST
jgi:alkaline phosphatase D